MCTSVSVAISKPNRCVELGALDGHACLWSIKLVTCVCKRCGMFGHALHIIV